MSSLSFEKRYYWRALLVLLMVRILMMSWASYAQYRFIMAESVPKELSKYIDQETWKRLSEKTIDTFKATISEYTLSVLLGLVVIGFDLLPKLWAPVDRIRSSRLTGPEGTLRKSIIFLVLFNALRILSICIISCFLRIECFGSSTLKWLANFTWNLATTIFLLFIYLVCKESKKKALLISFSIVVLYNFYGLFLEPIYVFSTVVAGKIPESFGINALLEKNGFPLSRFFVNAYTSGVGRFALIVYGTGLEKFGVKGREILAVIAHEIGHWKYNHTCVITAVEMMVWMTKICIFFYLIDNKSFLRSFGFSGPAVEGAFGLGLVLLEITLANLSEIWSPLINYFSWITEYQADAFSSKMGYAVEMMSFLDKIKEADPTVISTQAWGLLHFTHPVFSARMAALRKFLK